MNMSDAEFLRLMAEAEAEGGILADGTQARARLLAIAKRLEEIDAPGNYIAHQDGAGNWWRVNLDGSLVRMGPAS